MIKKRLGGLTDHVRMVVFSSDAQGVHGKHAEALAQEIAGLNPKISVDVYSLEQDVEKAGQYNIDKAPALILENKEGKQARFFGLPAGEEFNVFLSDLLDLSRNAPSLPQEIVRKAQEITTPTHLQVFVTASCPYCPGVVRLAHGLAMVNPHIRADMVRIEEFRSLADKYNVMGVPKTVVNGKAAIEGALPSDLFLKRISEMQK